ncbi:MAG TPA: zinc ribbon domain-containing protein [candidate division Zixibacteria bacterium]|nr:zinc ribbon domain-containing protein [candidate division Zixibacteria bacterium]
MPLYEYYCKACDHRFERIQKFSDPIVTVCPECKKQAVEQVITAPAVQFKGSGWYVTDYAKKGSSITSSASKVESSTESKTETAPPPSTGSKPETKPSASAD